MDLQPGVVIDRYEIVRPIGAGGMAEVHLVRHRTLGSFHALKVLTVPGADVRARLIEEGRLQARLRHANLLAVTDVVEVDGAPGLIMEFVDGPSMDLWLEQGRPPLDVAVRLFLGVLDAVQVAHDNDVVHRDLKPGNVLLAQQAGQLVPKVADFGIAKALAGDGVDPSHSRTGMGIGSPAYMAPEQFQDAKHVDRRADIFALGCILYEMTSGRRAFGGTQLARVFLAVSSGDFVHPRTHVPDLPEPVCRAILGCLVPDRERRIADCETLRRVMLGEQDWPIPKGCFDSSGPFAGVSDGDTYDPGAWARPADAPLDGAASAGRAVGVPTPPPPRVPSGPVSAAATVDPAPLATGARSANLRPTTVPQTGHGTRPLRALLGVVAAAGLVLVGAVAVVIVLVVARGLFLAEHAPVSDPVDVTDPPPAAEAVPEAVPEPPPPPTDAAASPGALPPADSPPADMASHLEPVAPTPVTRRAASEPTTTAARTPVASAGTAPVIVVVGAPEQAPNAAVGTLYVRGRSEQGEVRVDGTSRGRSLWRGDVPSGPHVVSLLGGDGRTATASIEVPEGKDTYVCLDLDRGGLCP